MLHVLLVLILILVISSSATGQGVEPWDGETFERAVAAQAGGFQDTLRTILPPELGCFVTGPLDIMQPDSAEIYHVVRIVCPDIQAQERALEQLEKSELLSIREIERAYDTSFAAYPPGVRGAVVAFAGDREIALVTFQQLRYLIWYRDNLMPAFHHRLVAECRSYAEAVSAYMHSVAMEEDHPSAPSAADYNLPTAADIFAPSPDYVIEGYQNYKDFLQAHAPIYTDFAQGLLAFIPSDSLAYLMRAAAPKAAFPNKEFSKLQEELKEFYEREGDPRIMATLTPEGFDTLRAGEYFFAVGLNGTIRFGRELLREEVKRIEAATGKKVARANHAFLFPGEPLLTAGAFFVEIVDSVPRLVEFNAQSGHYFYSNVTATIREDIAERSDYYLLTLGHFLEALDSLGLDYHGALIRKF